MCFFDCVCEKIAKWIERVFGRKADANLCVTRAMQTWLRDTWQIEATVLHDKPPLFFKPTSLDIQHDLFTRVGDQLEHCNDVRTIRSFVFALNFSLMSLYPVMLVAGDVGTERG